MKNFVFVNYTADISGSSVALKRLCLALEGSCRITLVTSPGGYLSTQDLGSSTEILERQVPLMVKTYNPIKWIAYFVQVKALGRYLSHIYQKNNAQLLLINCLPNMGSGLVSLGSMNAWWWVHELYLEPRFWLNAMVRLVAKRARGIYCVSEPSRNLFKANTHLLPGAVKISDLGAFKNPFEGDSLQLLWVGTVSPRKGLAQMDALLSSLGFIWNKISLVLCCSVTPKYRSYLDQCVKNFQLKKIDLEIRENVGDDNIPYGSDKILLQTSVLPESFGLTVLEGMARGMVVIAPGTGGVGDFGRHGENMLFLESREGDWLSRLQGLRENPRRLQALQAAARATAHRYTLECQRDEFLKLQG